MTDSQQVAERRRRRAAAQQLFDSIAVAYLDFPDVNRGAMFGSNGLRFRDKFFAFVGRDGDLIIKLPAAYAADLVAEGQATAIRAGRHATREWVSIPKPSRRGSVQRWSELVAAAHRYVSLLPSSSGRAASP